MALENVWRKIILNTPTTLALLASKRRGLVAFVFLLAIHVGEVRMFPSTSADTGKPQPISVQTELVILPVTVVDRSGLFVQDLTQNNFRIYDRNRAQDVSLFRIEDTPVSVGLIVDYSASMQSKLSQLRVAVSSFSKSSNSRDEMFIVTFSDKVTVHPSSDTFLGNDSDELETILKSTSTGGRTALYDAVAAGLNRLQHSHQDKKALIVISDGGDNASTYKRSEIVSLARKSGVTIYSLTLVDSLGKDQNPKALRQLCSETGGIALSPVSQESAITSSAQIAEDLRRQYVLGFVPSDNTNYGFHPLKVQVIEKSERELHVRTRSGYFRRAKETSFARSDAGL